MTRQRQAMNGAVTAPAALPDARCRPELGGDLAELTSALFDAVVELRALIERVDLIARALHDRVDPGGVCDTRDPRRAAAATLGEIDLDLRAVRERLRSAAVLAEPAVDDLRHLRPRGPGGKGAIT